MSDPGLVFERPGDGHPIRWPSVAAAAAAGGLYGEPVGS